jgi:antirestriction protein ArdC
VNAVSGKPYRGVNVLALWAAADAMGYRSNEWATYKQWQEKGAHVRKGEKSSLVVFWKIGDAKGADSDETDDGGKVAEAEEDRGRPILARGYVVFNADQVDGYTPKAAASPIPAQVQQQERIAHADQFFQALGADIRHGGNRAYYRPATDHIQMPPFEAFHDPIAYYAILGHEATHWTGPKHRLDRDLTGRFGNEAYAAEELIAELSAAFLSADLGLTNEPRPDHAAYVANWLKVLKNDNRAIFTAAGKAQQAVDYLHGLQEPEVTPKIAINTAPLPTP